MSIETVYFILLFGCLILSAFFSSAETAYISLSRIRLNHLVESNVSGAGRVLRIKERPERMLSTVLLGNNLVNTTATALATVLAISYFGEQYGVVIATIGLTVILLIFGEITPKTFATRHAEKVAIAYAGPIELLTRLFSPFVFVLSWIASGFMKVLGGGSAYHRSLFNEEEIRSLIDTGHKEGRVEKDQADMLHKVFDFCNRPVSKILVPRMEVAAVEKGTTLIQFLKTYAQTPVSRFPVYEDNLDNVVGVISIKDVLMAQANNEINLNDQIDGLIRPTYFAPESKLIDDLFREMRDNNQHMCIVIDEYGGTAGIVSMTRVLEEIVGPVGDEYLTVENDFETVNEYTFQVDGAMRIEDANQQLELQLPESDEYGTLAGFILKTLGRIPNKGQTMRYKNLKLVVTHMNGRKIDEVLITRDKTIPLPV
jgi:CBS domain containing-hemolysin-like protein